MGVVIINFIIIINTGQEEEAEGVRQRCLPVPLQRQYLNPNQRRARTFSCSLILRLHSEKLIYIVQMMVTKTKYIMPQILSHPLTEIHSMSLFVVQ